MECKVCNLEFKDILKHLRKNQDCASEYDVDQIIHERRLSRLDKMRTQQRANYVVKKSSKQDYYLANKSSIRAKQAEYTNANWSNIRVKNAKYKKVNSLVIKEKKTKYYSKKIGLILQKKRFYKHFRKEYAMKYITSSQDHVYYHTLGVCQVESMQSLNHSIQYSDGRCKFCDAHQGIKIIGVNRQVCMNCMKGQCVLCSSEVSPDPEFGCLHYSPDTGYLLSFLPDYCPLYSNHFFPQYQAINNPKNKKDCQICSSIKQDYPEYQILGDFETKNIMREEGLIYEQQEVFIYNCNLCDSKFNHLCEFDLHMRSHTKYGKNVVIFGLVSHPREEIISFRRVGDELFASIETEIMKVSGISAVLAVFGTERLKPFSYMKVDDDINLAASALIGEGVDIWFELEKSNIDSSIVEKIKILDVRNHFMTDKSTSCPFQTGYHKRKLFEEKLLRWNETPLMPGCQYENDSFWYSRSKSLLTARCALQFPVDRYKVFLPIGSRLNFSRHVMNFLWRRVKHCDLCCCISKYFCSSSKNIDKCKKECCKKCQEEQSLIEEDSSEKSRLDEREEAPGIDNQESTICDPKDIF